jgi:hypothetical protein
MTLFVRNKPLRIGSRNKPLPPLAGFLLAQFGNFTQELFLDSGLHLDTVEILSRLHDVTTSRGE